MQVKKILLVSNMYPSEENPSYGVFVKNFERLLVSRNIFVKKVVISGRGKNVLDKIKKYMYFIYMTLLNLKTKNWDLVYIHYIGHSLIPLLFVPKHMSTPLVVNAHGSDVLPSSIMGKVIQKLVMSVVMRADLIVVPSSYFKNIVLNKFDIDTSKVFISPSAGINTMLFKPKYMKKKLDVLTVGYVSRIDEGKGWDILLYAISELIKHYDIQVKVLMIGGGSQEKNLIELIKYLNLENHIDFIGQVPHQELVQYYNKMDVFTFTTRLSESLGLVGLEAMACGVPVVGSKIGGLEDYIEDNKNGMLFEVDNVKLLAEKLYSFVKMSNVERKVFSKNALKTAREFDSELVTKQLIQRLNKVIENK